MGLTHNAGIVTDGLVLCLDAGNPRSYPRIGSTFFDLSSNRTNFTIYNGTYYSSGIPSAMVFDGVDDNIGRAAPISLQLKNDISIEAYWKHYSSGGDDWAAIIRVGLSSDLLYMMTSDKTNKRIILQYYENAFRNAYSTSNSVILDVFNHGVISIKNNVCSFYINGKFLNSVNVTTPTPASASEIGIGSARMGGYIGSTAQDLYGEIAVIKVYNKALSSDEVSQNFNSTRSRFGI